VNIFMSVKYLIVFTFDFILRFLAPILLMFLEIDHQYAMDITYVVKHLRTTSIK